MPVPFTLSFETHATSLLSNTLLTDSIELNCLIFSIGAQVSATTGP